MFYNSGRLGPAVSIVFHLSTCMVSLFPLMRLGAAWPVCVTRRSFEASLVARGGGSILERHSNFIGFQANYDPP
jgi:hypothetical protein